jgi:hypothetical protein
MNGDLRFVARLYPCGHFPPQGLEVPDPPVQTLCPFLGGTMPQKHSWMKQ